MNSSKIGSANDQGDGNPDQRQLLRDIEEISKALYLPKPATKDLIVPYSNRSKSAERTRFSKPKSTGNVFQKSKKPPSSLWDWKKPLKALAHMRHQRFNICFYLHVHSIEGLAANFDDATLRVHWKRKDEMLQTLPSTVIEGIAEFEQTLMHKCVVYGSRSGVQNLAKYEPKLSLIYISVVGASGVVNGKHWIDLTRLLPVTLEELEGEKSTGKWTTSFKLAGKAKGATLNVSFGFSVTRDTLVESTNLNLSDLVDLTQKRSTDVDYGAGVGPNNDNKMLRWVGSVPNTVNIRSAVSSRSSDAKVHRQGSSITRLELSKSINFLYAKLSEETLHGLQDSDSQSGHVELLNTKRLSDFESVKDNSGSECDYTEFDVIEQGIEMSGKEELKSFQNDFHIDDSAIEIINVDQAIKDNDVADYGEVDRNLKENTSNPYTKEVLTNDGKCAKDSLHSLRSTMEEVESDVRGVVNPELTDLRYPLTMYEFSGQENHMEVKSNYRASRMSNKSLSMDDITEFVTSDFFSMLGIEQSNGSSSDNDPESPRERLLKEFERETLASGNFIFGFDTGEDSVGTSCLASTESESGNSYYGFDFVPFVKVNQKEQKESSPTMKSRRKPKFLEDSETKALMQEWGLNETTFQSSPRYHSNGFGSPIELPPEDPFRLPQLGEGFGPFLQLKNGGYLWTMSTSLFRNAKNVGDLVMQGSRAVVLPADMGYEIIDILQHMASLGIRKLSMQLKDLMPLEDITGKTLQQVAQEDEPRQALQQGESLFRQDSFNRRKENGSFPFGWSYYNVGSSSIDAEMGSEFVSLKDFSSSTIERIETLLIEGLRIQSGLSSGEAPSCIRTHTVEKKSNFDYKNCSIKQELDVSGLMNLSMPLDEWLKLDGDFISDEDHTSERTVRILADHHAKCIDLTSGTLIRHLNEDKTLDRSRGLFQKNITIAIMVLLRDPHRNYEPVGTSMLALFQGERVSVSEKVKRHSTLLDGNGELENDPNLKEEKGIPLFKISEVHLAGVKTDLSKNELWGSKAQQQCGTRWLLTSGMGKSYKYPVSKSKTVIMSHPQDTRKNEDLLWSITSNSHRTDDGWKLEQNPYSRNPDVVFPN